MSSLRARVRVWLLPAGLLVAGFLLYARHLENNDRTWFLPRLVVRVASPALRGIDRVFGVLHSGYARYLRLVGVAEQNELLRKRIAQMEWELNSYREMALANERYRRLFEFRFASGFESLTARVIARDPNAWSSSLILDRGSRSGVRPHMCVTTDQGVVGQVVSTTATTCQVQTLLDPGSSAAVLLQDSRTHAVVSGQGEDRDLLLRFIDKSSPTRPAEVVVTSGLDGVYPHGLKVGTVTAIEKLPETLFQTVRVRPSVDLYHLEEVLILLDSSDFLAPLSGDVHERVPR
jgi:rod shape-determining protein MreC